MTQLVMMTPDEVRILLHDELTKVLGSEIMPAKASELEVLKRKKLLTPKEVQKLYGLNAKTLATKRCLGTGPAYVQFEKNSPIYYEHSSLQKYLDMYRKVSYV